MKEKFMNGLGKFVAYMFLLLVCAFVNGVVLMYLWNWFIAPLGVVVINYWWAMGISFTITAFVGVKENKSETSIYVQMFAKILASLVVWGLGALVALGM